ncbi:MAG: RNA-binding protein [Candidatus Woesearchaeota archaeon]|nr:MAG: RNA-binding protein [Candidatus Woesearchaeota archaeon]
MGELKVKEKDLVIPGEILAEGMDYLPSTGTFREGEHILSSLVGLTYISGRLIKVIPLSGKYVPKKDDMVIGTVKNITLNGWIIELGGPYTGMLTLKEASSDFIERGADLSQYFDFGDMLVTKIVNITKSKIIDFTMKGPGLRKLKGGKVIQITPSKVPRVIGKQGSMISMIKESTGCRVIIGQNGRVWISGNKPEEELKATRAIMIIEQESHTEGLTDKIKNFLEKGV